LSNLFETVLETKEEEGSAPACSLSPRYSRRRLGSPPSWGTSYLFFFWLWETSEAYWLKLRRPPLFSGVLQF